MPLSRSPASRGFTLLELACVVAMIAALLSLSVPSYRVYQNRALASEATINLQTISYLELVSELETGALVACPMNPAEIPAPKSPFVVDDHWRSLGFEPEGRVRHQYEVLVEGDRFVARARGDVDQDGVVAEYSINSDTMTLVQRFPGE